MVHRGRIQKQPWRQPRTLAEARQRGGPPFQQGRIAKEKLEALWRVLDGERAIADQSLAKQIRSRRLAPNETGTTILLNRGEQPWKMQSIHEAMEYSGEFVMTAYTTEALNGRDRDKVLAAQPADYKKFRATWSKIRETVIAVLPETGEPFDGAIPAEPK